MAGKTIQEDLLGRMTDKSMTRESGAALGSGSFNPANMNRATQTLDKVGQDYVSATNALNVASNNSIKAIINNGRAAVESNRKLSEIKLKGTAEEMAQYTADRAAHAKNFTSNSGKVLTNAGGLVLGAGKKFLDGAADVLNMYNDTWKKAYAGGPAGLLSGMSQNVVKALPIGDKYKSALGGMMDNLIQGLSFIFEQNLVYMKAKYAAGAQLGFGKAGSAEDIKNRQITGATDKYTASLTRTKAMEWQGALVGAGATDQYEKVLSQSLKLGTALGMDAAATAAMTREYMSLGMTGVQAGTTIEESWRKVQFAVQGTGIPVKKLVSDITAGATAARFMNVDVITLTNTMAMFASKQKEAAKFGVDITKEGATISKEIAGLGSKSEAMQMWYGSNMGKEDIGMKAMTKGQYGTSAAENLKATAGGGFTMAGADTSNNAMTLNKMKMLKDAMMQASAGMDADSALFMQKKVAMELEGVSSSTANLLAMTSKEDLDKTPELKGAFDTTEKVLQDMRSMDSIKEQLQRDLVKLNMGIFTETIIMSRIAQLKLKKDEGMTEGSYKSEMESLKSALTNNETAMKSATSNVFGSLKTITGPFGQIIEQAYGKKVSNDAISGAIGKGIGETDKDRKQTDFEKLHPGKTLDENGNIAKKASGGYVGAGVPFEFGEKGPEMLQMGGKNFYLPGESGSSGNVIPNDKLTSSSSNTSKSGDVTNVTLTFHGVGTDQIVSKIVESVRSNLQ